MNQQRIFARKIAYVVAIGLLLIPLFLLARPASSGRPGGKLSQLREEQGLSEAQLGKIDPASEAMKLSTFGMRGVATAILWSKVQNFQKKKDWTNVAATSNQIIRLEPHYIQVWKYQAWNIAYNVSSEFDDFRERYRWVIKGIEFLIEGISYNQRNPPLHCDVGWDFAQKIGTADEKVEFRTMFLKDDELHSRLGTSTLHDRDNWLVGKSWYDKAEKLIQEGESIGKMGDNVFYARRPMCQINYSKNIQSDGKEFGERAGENWAQAHREWTEEFGTLPIHTTFQDDNGKLIKIVLNDYEGLSEEVDLLTRQLDDLDPGLRERLILQRWENLDKPDRDAWRFYVSHDTDLPGRIATVELLDDHDPAWRSTDVDLVRDQITKQQAAALETPSAMRSERELKLAAQADRTIEQAVALVRDALVVTQKDVAQRLKGDDRRKAFEIVEEIDKIERKRRIIGSYRQVVNYEEWEFRSRYEQLAETLGAREQIFKGREALDNGLLPDAFAHFNQGFADWGALLAREDCKQLERDHETVDDLKEVIKSYVALLGQRDELFPEDFPLGGFYAGQALLEPTGYIKKARDAREYAAEALDRGDTKKAIAGYEKALEAWTNAAMEFPALALMISRPIGAEILESIEEYSAALAKDGKAMPTDYPMAKFLAMQLNHAPERLAAKDRYLLASNHAGNSEYPQAQEHLEEALRQWRQLLDRYPSLMNGSSIMTQQEITATLTLYRQVLGLRGQELPEDFPLQDFADLLEKKA